MLSAPVAHDAYAVAFAEERARVYPQMDAFERAAGCMVDRDHLEAAARVLACPVKAHPPNWQHGRLIYALTRRYLGDRVLAGQGDPVVLLDIGTAKGFSALCLTWALRDAGCRGQVVSCDVVDPSARVARNTVAEVDGLRTLADTIAPWPEARTIEFVRSSGRLWLTEHVGRVHVAVVDGKHTYDAVSWECALLTERQHHGDVIFLDDLQIPGVAQAVRELRSYAIERLEALPGRQYAIARKH